MNLTRNQIENIAEELESGMKVYLNIETMEIKTILDWDDNYLSSEDEWDDDLKEIENNFDKYIMFEKMDSRESFRVMENFVDLVEDTELKNKLDLGLSLSKPFRNFKDIIDSESEYREKWFQFKKQKYIEYVIEQIDFHNSK